MLSAAPRRTQAEAGTSWLGSPPTRLRRATDDVDDSRTYDPPDAAAGRSGRRGGLPARCPVIVAAAIGLGLRRGLETLVDRTHVVVAAVASGALLMLAGLVAAGTATAAKWLLVGRHRAGDRPLWSSFVWRNELADAFVELVAAPWFARPAMGTPALNIWLRTLGTTVGRGVWCETYWLPEPDLVELRDGATVNAGCVVQTHLFHDRVMSMDRWSCDGARRSGPTASSCPRRPSAGTLRWARCRW